MRDAVTCTIVNTGFHDYDLFWKSKGQGMIPT